MRCSTARVLMTKQLREPLSGSDASALAGHLTACGECTGELTQLLALEAALREVQPGIQAAQAPSVRVNTAAILDRRADAVLQEDAARRRSRRLFRPWAFALAGAGAAAALFVYLNQPKPPSWVQVADRPKVRTGHSPRRRPELPRTKPSPTPVVTLDGPPPVFHSDRPTIPMVLRQRTPLSRRNLPVPQEPERPAVVDHEPEQMALGGPDQVLPVAFVAPEPPMPETGKIDRVFLGDAALKAPLTLSERDRSLGELLPRLGRSLKVRTTAARNVADDKVSLLLAPRPAAEVLTLIGRHLGFRWRRTSDGYELTQDIAGRQREEALFRNELEPIEAQLNLASRMMRLTPKDRKARLDALDAELKDEALTPPERARLAAEKQIAIDALVAAPTVDVSLTLFRALTPAQIDSLLGGTELTYSTATDTLSPELAEKIYETTSILERGEVLGKLQADATIRVTDVLDQDELPPPRKQRQLRLECQFNTVRGDRKDPRYWGTRWFPSIPEIQDEAMTVPSTNDPDLKRTVELTLPGPTRTAPSWQGGSIIGAATLGYVWPRYTTLAEVSEAIHRASGLEVVADSFVSARLDAVPLRLKQPLINVLALIARELDYQWEKKGHTLYLRSRRFYRDRPAEVPTRVSEAFRTRVERDQRLTLDSVSDLVAALPDPQVRSLYRYWGWYLEGSGILPVESLFPRRAHFRFWSGLSPTQKSAARAGTILPVAMMLPAQQALWTAALFSPPVSSRSPSSELRAPTREELAGGGFSMRGYEAQLMSFIRPVDDGKRLVGTSVVAEGPRTTNPLDFVSDGNGNKPEGAGPQISVDGHDFRYYLGGRKEPAVKDNIYIAPTPVRK